MFSQESAEIALDIPCRSGCSVRADRTESRFFVGSCASASENNYLHVVHFNPEMNDMSVDAKILHHGSVEAICSSPDDVRLVCTANNSSTLFLHKIADTIMTRNNNNNNNSYHMDKDNDQALDQTISSNHIDPLISIETNGIVADICWGDNTIEDSSSVTTTKNGQLLFITRKGYLTQWDLQSNQSLQTNHFESKFIAGLLPRVTWDPHGNGNAVAVTAGNKVHILDWRTDTSIPTGTVDSFLAHRQGGGVTAIDYNPNKPYVLATAGQDTLMKFWDLRSTLRPLLVTRGGHSHWVSSLHYNPFHDQLVLSSGTDSIANLWRLSTISSAPMLLSMHDTLIDHTMPHPKDEHHNHNNNNDTTRTNDLATILPSTTTTHDTGPNIRIARHEHVDGIYSSCWSAADAWVYMTLGYDGIVQCNQVPSKEKYRILL